MTWEFCKSTVEYRKQNISNSRIISQISFLITFVILIIFLDYFLNMSKSYNSKKYFISLPTRGLPIIFLDPRYLSHMDIFILYRGNLIKITLKLPQMEPQHPPHVDPHYLSDVDIFPKTTHGVNK